MKWEKAPEELKQKFEAAFPPAPAERRQMFGYPAGFVNGNMFGGLHEARVVLRLPEAERKKLLDGGAKLFEPMPGRPMKEYVVLPPKLVDDAQKLKQWAQVAAKYTGTLPAKGAKKTKTKAKPARKR